MSVPLFVRRALVWVLVSLVVAAGPLASAGAEEDDRPGASVTDASIVEGDAGTATMRFVVTLSRPADQDWSVRWATSTFEGPTTATQDIDLRVPADHVLTIPAGATSGTIEITILGDEYTEDDERFYLALLDPQGPADVRVDRVVAEGLILDDGDDGGPQPAPPTATVTDVSVVEGDSWALTPMPFEITLSHPVGWDVVLQWQPESPRDGSPAAGRFDYTVPGWPGVTIPAGETTATVSFAARGDDEDEPDEHVWFHLWSSTGASAVDVTAVGTIVDDDAPLPVVSVTDATASEGDGSLVFRVSLEHPSPGGIEVDVATREVTASDGGDYTGVSRRLYFTKDVRFFDIDVPIVDDDAAEADETLDLMVTPVRGAVAHDDAGVGTIVDDDEAPAEPPAAYVTGSWLPEHEGELRFPISLSWPSDEPMLVEYEVVGGTATAGVDFAASTGSVEIPADAVHGAILFPIVDDAIDEPDETVVLRLTATGATLVWDEVDGTIIDDDEAPPVVPDITVADSFAHEDDGEMTFTISLSEPTTVPVTVDYATGDSTSSNGARHHRDFLFTSGTATFEPGTTTLAVSVPLVDDLVPELTESFRFLLEASTGGVIVDRRANGTIGDDDPVRLGSVL